MIRFSNNWSISFSKWSSLKLKFNNLIRMNIVSIKKNITKTLWVNFSNNSMKRQLNSTNFSINFAFSNKITPNKINCYRKNFPCQTITLIICKFSPINLKNKFYKIKISMTQCLITQINKKLFSKKNCLYLNNHSLIKQKEELMQKNLIISKMLMSCTNKISDSNKKSWNSKDKITSRKYQPL